MLFKLDKNNKSYNNVKKITFNDIDWKENDLEDLVLKNIQDFISQDLMVIFTKRDKQEPLVMALDNKSDLYIFELNRFELNNEKLNGENLLQLLHYGQIYSGDTYDE